MALVRVMRRRTRLNEKAKAKQDAHLLTDPWDEAGRRLKQSVMDSENNTDLNEDTSDFEDDQ